MNVAVTATLKTVGLLFVELNMQQIWAARRVGQLGSGGSPNRYGRLSQSALPFSISSAN